MAREDDRSKVIIPIAIVALVMMIPLVAIVGAQAWFPWLAGLIIVLGGGTLAGRHLLDHRHELRMAEIEAQRRLLEEERSQLDIANRILEADERALRRDLGDPGTIEA